MFHFGERDAILSSTRSVFPRIFVCVCPHSSSNGFVLPDGPHLLALSHSPLVISLMSSFLDRHPEFSSVPARISKPDALVKLAQIGHDPAIATRDPNNQLSFSLASKQEVADGQERLDEMIKNEKECLLVLPMCHELNDWEEPKTAAERERKLRRWK